MEKLLNLISKERKAFKKHFLVAVHSEIRFKSIDIDEIIKRQSELESAFRALGFPESRQMVRGALKLEAGPNIPAKVSHEAIQPIGLSFVSQRPKREFQILTDKIIVSDFAYDGIESFLSRFRAYFSAVASILDPMPSLAVNKIGLRKHDSIFIEPAVSFTDALSIFNPALFSTVRTGLVKNEAFRVTEETTVLEKDNRVCVLKANLQRVNEKALNANLDFDLVSLEAATFDEAFSTIIPTLNQYHFDLFMWAVTDQMIQLMENG